MSGRKVPWATFAALSLGMIVFGLAESYGPLTVATNLVPKNYWWLGYSLPFIFGGIGAFIAGYLADNVGRKPTFMIAAGMVVVGLILYAPMLFNLLTPGSPAYMPALVASMALIGMGAIGIESPVLTMLAESASAEYRSKLLVLAPNFGNLGVALAFVPAVLLGMNSSAASVAEERVGLMLMYAAPLAALIITWLVVNESLPWQAVKEGNNVVEAWRQIDDARETVTPTAGVGFRILTLLLLGISQDVAFVYFTYEAPWSFQGTIAGTNLGSLVPLLGGFIMTAVGIIAGLTITNKLNRKSFALLSFGLMAALWAVLAAAGLATGLTANYIILIAFIAIMVPTELTWAARALLEPELFPTAKRASYVSLVRMIVWVVTGFITAALSLVTMQQAGALASVSVILLAGVSGAMIWSIRGFETMGKNLVGLDLTHKLNAPVKPEPGNKK